MRFANAGELAKRLDDFTFSPGSPDAARGLLFFSNPYHPRLLSGLILSTRIHTHTDDRAPLAKLFGILLEQYISSEEHFARVTPEHELLVSLTQEFQDTSALYDAMFSHNSLPNKNLVILDLLTRIAQSHLWFNNINSLVNSLCQFQRRGGYGDVPLRAKLMSVRSRLWSPDDKIKALREVQFSACFVSALSVIVLSLPR